MSDGLRGILSNINPFKGVSYLEDGTPKKIVRSKNRTMGSMSSGKRSKAKLVKYWKYYKKVDTVSASINSITFNTVMSGYSIESDDEEARKLIENWCDKVDLETHILDNLRYSLVLGDAFIEIVKNKKGEPSSLLHLDPKDMKIVTDDHGIVQNYVLQAGSMSGDNDITYDKEEICHLKMFSQPDTTYGISMIESTEDTIDKKIQTDNAIANAIIRHGTSKLVFTVGSEKDKKIPPDEILRKIENEVEDIDEKNEFIVPWNVKVQSIDEKGISGVEEYFNYFQSQLVVGMMCPEEALGLGTGSTEATSKTKSILYERMIKSFQKRLARTIKKQLFNKILIANKMDEDLVEIEFRSVTEEDEANKTKWMGNFIRAFRSSKVKPLTINEMRKVMGFKPIDQPEANSIIYEGKEDSIQQDEDNDKDIEEEDIEEEEEENEN